jgi:hypothetical protein
LVGVDELSTFCLGQRSRTLIGKPLVFVFTTLRKYRVCSFPSAKTHFREKQTMTRRRQRAG